jgi:hypothetical protein
MGLCTAGPAAAGATMVDSGMRDRVSGALLDRAIIAKMTCVTAVERLSIRCRATRSRERHRPGWSRRAG